MFHRGNAKSWFYRLLFGVERGSKEFLFGCHSCGQCLARTTGLVCPMQCPKPLRNGPCGGTRDGYCEVFPERKCVWVRIYKSSELFGQLEHLKKPQPAVDWSLFGTSAWANLFVNKTIDWRGHALSPSPWKAKYYEMKSRGGNEE
jgi:hypothetical protein